MHRLCFDISVFAVDVRHQFVRGFTQFHVFGHVTAARHRHLNEQHVIGHERVLLQIALEAQQLVVNAFDVVKAIDADDDAATRELLLEVVQVLLCCCCCHGSEDGFRIDANREGADVASASVWCMDDRESWRLLLLLCDDELIELLLLLLLLLTISFPLTTTTTITPHLILHHVRLYACSQHSAARCLKVPLVVMSVESQQCCC